MSTGISIREAAVPPESMGFTLVGCALVIPFILLHRNVYYGFRGKVRPERGTTDECGTHRGHRHASEGRLACSDLGGQGTAMGVVEARFRVV